LLRDAGRHLIGSTKRSVLGFSAHAR
jgi:hypothetical protein